MTLKKIFPKVFVSLSAKGRKEKNRDRKTPTLTVVRDAKRSRDLFDARLWSGKLEGHSKFGGRVSRENIMADGVFTEIFVLR